MRGGKARGHHPNPGRKCRKPKALEHITEEGVRSEDFGEWAPRELGEEVSRMTPRFPAYVPAREPSPFTRTGSHARDI